MKTVHMTAASSIQRPVVSSGMGDYMAKESTPNMQEIAAELGVTTTDVRRLVKSIAYRKSYNLRPDVLVKRAEYNKRKNQELKLVKAALRAHPELLTMDAEKGGE